MEIQGLDYNTQREKLLMPEYGREIQKKRKLCHPVLNRSLAKNG